MSAMRAAGALARRVVGPLADAITFGSLEADAPRGYEYRAAGGALEIQASDAVAAAVGLHAYVQRACDRQVCWDTALPLPLRELPDAPRTRQAARVQLGYYLNFCTSSYTAAYWDWPRWERELDWMALHGITMPLAITGHEAILHEVYTGMGLDDAEVRRFLGGPGYLPFQFMGCLDGFAGPLPSAWIDAHAELGARIVRRERELGMTPVLPAFTGHVPARLAGEGSTVRDWTGFASHFLDPADPRFADISRRIVRAQAERFGTDHLYAADPFIEMVPPSAEPAYLAALARTTLAGLRAGDPRAVWVMQTWPFSYHAHWWSDERIAALVDAVPDDALLLLDLWAEHDPQWTRFGGFRGKRWIWCGLHGFGGRADLVGDVPAIRHELERALACSEPPVGVGLAMEATETNQVVYELIAEQPWASIDDLGAWGATFARRRYGATIAEVEGAWRLLLRTVYAAPANRLEPQVFTGVLSQVPRYGDALDSDVARRHVDAARWYDGEQLRNAWEALLLAAERRPDLVRGSLGHDLAMVVATGMARVIDELYVATVQAAAGAARATAGQRFLDAFLDLDALLDTRPELRLRTWERAATSWATDDDERELLLDNARRIVTVWTEPDHPMLDDYSARPWSGLVGGYYRARWRVWLDGLAGGADPDALASGLGEVARAFLRSGAVPVSHTETTTTAEARRLLDRHGGVLAQLRATA